MTAKETTNISEALEKQGYEIIGIAEEREVPGFFPKFIKITLSYIGAKPSKLK